jgi:hypothetical protein
MLLFEHTVLGTVLACVGMFCDDASAAAAESPQLSLISKPKITVMTEKSGLAKIDAHCIDYIIDLCTSNHAPGFCHQRRAV